MPARVFNGYARNIAAHMASDALRLIAIMQAGTGQMKEEQRTKYIRGLQTSANHGTTPRSGAHRFSSGEEALRFMGSIGAIVPDGAA